MTRAAPETVIVDSYRVACDGGDGGMGHPRVWLQIPEETGVVECKYCGRRMVHSDHTEHAE